MVKNFPSVVVTVFNSPNFKIKTFTLPPSSLYDLKLKLMSLAFKFFDKKENANCTEDDGNEADDSVQRLKT